MIWLLRTLLLFAAMICGYFAMLLPSQWFPLSAGLAALLTATFVRNEPVRIIAGILGWIAVVFIAALLPILFTGGFIRRE